MIAMRCRLPGVQSLHRNCDGSFGRNSTIYKQTYLKPEGIVPLFTRRVLLIGPVIETIRREIASRCMVVDAASETDLEPISSLELDTDAYECLVVHMATDAKPALEDWVALADRILKKEGQLSILFDSAFIPVVTGESFESFMARAGFMKYGSGMVPNVRGKALVHGVSFVRAGYNTVKHARILSRAGRPNESVSVLEQIPMDLISDNNLLADIAFEKQQYYFEWQKARKGLDPDHALFSKARREFAQVTAVDPTRAGSYRLHARYWEYLGRPDMAKRVVRSIEHVMPGTDNRQVLDRLSGCPQITCSAPVVEKWDFHRRNPRILVITHDHSDYGLDTLYHGLCNLIGKGNVVEYPWKPTLHGRNPEAVQGYPCFFNHPGEPVSLDLLVHGLRAGEFDFILYADVVQMSRQAEVARLMEAAGDLPLIIYDTWDDCFTPIRRIQNYLGRERIDLVFKREMIAGVKYPERTFPLPFGYPAGDNGERPGAGKTRMFFWAGKDEYGLRPLYVKALEELAGCNLHRRYSQEAYRIELQRSLIGISMFGCGFDTVRYWELPANRVMLLAERPPIISPHNFVDGKSAVFFEDLPSLLERLTCLSSNTAEAMEIAEAGYRHFMDFHTATARAGQFLELAARHIHWS